MAIIYLDNCTCDDTMFTCTSESVCQCIDKEKACDGVEDCAGGLDEASCESKCME